MTGTTAAVRSRPLRADARRNYDRLVVVARAVFTERGSDASLDEIARRACVGIGTLYRHFPTRLALIEAVYVDDVEALERAAQEHASGDPWQGLVAWAHQLVVYMATKKALFAELQDAADKDSELMSFCRDSLYRGAATVLERAQQAGVIRADLDKVDLLTLIHGVIATRAHQPDRTERLLGLILDGLRADSARPTSRE